MLVTRDVRQGPGADDADHRLQEARHARSRARSSATSPPTSRRTGNAAGESPLGDLIADAQLADPSVVTGGQTPVIAFMNPGGIRADLTYANSNVRRAPTATSPTRRRSRSSRSTTTSCRWTSRAQDIYDLLTQQVTGANAGPRKKTLQVSQRLHLHHDADRCRWTASVKLERRRRSTRPRPTGSSTNNFLSDGGDNFPAFKNGTNKYFGGLDIDGFANYLPTVSPYTPAAPTRISGSN